MIIKMDNRETYQGIPDGSRSSSSRFSGCFGDISDLWWQRCIHPEEGHHEQHLLIGGITPFMNIPVN